MTTSINHAHPRIFGLLLALSACPQKDPPATTDDPQDVDTTSDASASTATATPTTSGEPSTTTSESTAESDISSTSSTTTSSTTTSSTTTSETTVDPDMTSSTTTVDPDTTTGGVCPFDLIVSLALGFDECDGQLVLIATVHNVGIVDVPSGIDVTFFEGTDNSGSKLVTVPTSEPLFAGGSTDVGFAVIAPPADEPRDYYAEVADGCGDVITDAACPG